MAKVSFIAMASAAICASLSSVGAVELPIGCVRTGLSGDVTGGFFFRCPDGTNYLPQGGSFVPVDRYGRPLPEMNTDTTAPEAGSDMQPVEETTDEAAEPRIGDPEAAPEMMAPEAEADAQPAETEDAGGPQWSAPDGESGVRSAASPPEEQSGPRFQTAPE